jgi:hypothetical protein
MIHISFVSEPLPWLYATVPVRYRVTGCAGRGLRPYSCATGLRFAPGCGLHPYPCAVVPVRYRVAGCPRARARPWLCGGWVARRVPASRRQDYCWNMIMIRIRIGATVAARAQRDAGGDWRSYSGNSDSSGSLSVPASGSPLVGTASGEVGSLSLAGGSATGSDDLLAAGAAPLKKPRSV